MDKSHTKQHIIEHYSNEKGVDSWKNRFEAKDITGFLKRAQLKLFKRKYSALKDLNILDVACGNGAYSIFLAKQNKVTAVDISPGMVKNAKELAVKENVDNNFKALVADAEHLPFKDNQFDIVMCLDTLHHFYDNTLTSILKEFHRVLNPSGILIIDYKNKNNPYLNYSFRKKSHDKFILISRNFTQIKTILNSVGFKTTKSYNVLLPILPPFVIVEAKKC